MMGLVAAKCTQCGANIEVDASKDAGICSHCRTAFITEKAVNNYNNTFNIQNATFSVNVQDVEKMTIVQVNQKDLWKKDIYAALNKVKKDISFLKDPPKAKESPILLPSLVGALTFTWITSMMVIPSIVFFTIIAWVGVVYGINIYSENREYNNRIEQQKKFAAESVKNTLSSLKSKNQDFEYKNLVDFIYKDFSK